MGLYTRDKWLIHGSKHDKDKQFGTKPHKDTQLQILEYMWRL